MKKVIIGMMVVAVLLFAAVVWAADEAQVPAGAEGQKAPRTPGMRPGMPMRGAGPNQGAGGMKQGFETMMKEREEAHKKAVGELEEIKKIAESEKATKTAEALQKMIDKKNEEFNKTVEEIQKRQKERMEMIQKRQQEMEARKAAQPATEEKKAEKTEK